MSTAPGVQITSTTAKRRKRTGVIPATVFMPVVSLRGPHDAAVEVSSMDEAEALFGARDAGSVWWDDLETLFLEGAPRAFLTRIVGPAAARASKTLSNGTTTALTLTAVQHGAYWNAATVAVDAAGGSFTLTITEPDGTVHTSPPLADLTAAVAWVGATASTGELAHFTMTSTGSTDPVTAAAAPLTGGNDDRAGITETQRQTATDLLERKYGSGTYVESGSASAAAVARIAAHCTATNRIAEVNLAQGVTVEDAITAAAALLDDVDMDRVKMHTSHARVAGVELGTKRVIGWSVIEAGILGANDAAGVPVGQPAAGGYGVSKTALELVREYTDAERAALNDAHVNVAIAEDGVIMGYGNRSLSTKPGEKLFSMARTKMVVQAEAERSGKLYVHRLVDGEGHVLAMFLKDLIGICQRYRAEGSLFGATDEDAFRVEVFEVNTDENLLEGILNAAIDILPSGAAEFVRINITAHADKIGA